MTKGAAVDWIGLNCLHVRKQREWGPQGESVDLWKANGEALDW